MKFQINKLNRNGTSSNHITYTPSWKLEDDEINYLRFNCKTYSNLSTDEAILNRLTPIPLFLEKTFNINEHKRLVNMFINIKKRFLAAETEDFVEDNFEKTLYIISDIIAEGFEDVQFIQKAKKYVIDGNVPVPDLDKIKARPQDHQSTTFVIEDYYELTTLSLVCKFLFGVLGEVIYYVSKKDIDNSVKEIYATFVLSRIINTHFSYITEKLVFYVDHNVGKVREKDQINSLFKGFDNSKMTLSIYAILIIKKLVNVNLYDPGKNIMVYLYQCIGLTLDSLCGALKKSCRIKERYYGNENFSEDGEIDILDDEASSLATNFDVPSLIRKSINEFVDNIIIKLNIDVATFNAIKNYYLKNQLCITPINEFVVSIFTFDAIKSGASVEFLRINEYAKLITILQLIMCKDPEYRDLLHLLSVNIGESKSLRSDTDHCISIKSVDESYRYIKSQLGHLGKIDWVAPINNIASCIINNNLHYNTSPIILELLSESDRNSEIMSDYDVNIIKKIYDFIVMVLF